MSITRFDVRTTATASAFAGRGLRAVSRDRARALRAEHRPALTRTVLATDLLGMWDLVQAARVAVAALEAFQVGRSFRFWQNHYGELQAVPRSSLGRRRRNALPRGERQTVPHRVEADK